MTDVTTTTTTTTLLSEDIMWAGTESNNLYGMQYNTDETTLLFSNNLGSPINKILFGIDNHFMYISTFNDLYKYSVDNFKEGKELKQLVAVANDENMIMSAYKDDNDSVWAVDSYQGRVFKLNSDDLSIEETFDDFAAPFKIRYSAYHNAYFVADSYILWQIDASDNVTIVYEINDYRIVDFDISESGAICLLFDGLDEDIMRVLDGDKYTFLLDERISDSNLRFCVYCGEGRFYALGEVITTSTEYSSSHYVFNVGTKLFTKTNSSKTLTVTTTTTTLGTITKAVQVIVPNGGELFQLGSEYYISWVSSKAAADAVKIDLYKGGEFYTNITESTENIGVYPWILQKNIDEGDDYRVRITWISASSDLNNYDESDSDFAIAKTVAVTTTTTTLPFTDASIGITYDSDSDQIVDMLRSGLFLVFNLSDFLIYGLIESDAVNALSVAANGFTIQGIDKQTKVRIFVGSERYQSDRWDSGIIETELKSMYYGGGNNLCRGKKYYVHIQTYSNKYGWGEIQIREFVMPK